MLGLSERKWEDKGEEQPAHWHLYHHLIAAADKVVDVSFAILPYTRVIVHVSSFNFMLTLFSDTYAGSFVS